MTSIPVYFHIQPGGPLPDVRYLSPFRAVVVVESGGTSEWQARVSDWLVQSGCLYMLAWGRECSSWDDSVDIANLEQFNYKDIPEDRSVMTTWHANETLAEAFAFCKYQALHPAVAIDNTVVVHITERADESKILEAYAES